jgi:ketosteroid isomerase-like protein
MISTGIHGKDTSFSLDSPLEALASFYLAFNSRNLSLMESVWLDGQEPTMDNPMGGIRRGWAEIKAGYEKLFSGNARLEVEFHDYTIQEFGCVAIAIGRERGWCETPAGKLGLAIRTSRIFVRTREGWKQLHHHGSVEYPAMLEQYQKFILGKTLTAALS